MPNSIRLVGVTVMTGTFPLLRGITLMVESGTVIMINGRNGSGKSTLLEVCAGLKVPDRGEVVWDGVAIVSLSRQHLLAKRQRIGYMFQQHALITNFTIFDNIALPLRAQSLHSEREISVKVHKIMEEVALFGVDTAFPEALSAGQLKSVALARALVTDPDILLLDEPLSGIARQAIDGIRGVLIAAQNEKRRTVICTSHEPIPWATGDVVYYLLDGGKITISTFQELYSQFDGAADE